MRKNKLEFLIVLPVLVLVMWIFYQWIGGALCNDMKAAGIERSFSEMELPPETECLETKSFVGNTSGTGNHTEIWAGMLIQSALAKEELGRYFEGYEIHTISECMENSFLASMKFSVLSESPHAQQDREYFVVDNYYEPFTQSDLRGH